jgi:hypothetical protein
MTNVVQSIVGCARCDGDGHDNLIFEPFTRQVEMGDGSRATHWTMCPTLGEPILLVIIDVRLEPVNAKDATG